LEVQQQVDMKTVSFTQALAWGMAPQIIEPFLTFIAETEGVLHDYDKPLKRFHNCAREEPKLKLGVMNWF